MMCAALNYFVMRYRAYRFKAGFIMRNKSSIVRIVCNFVVNRTAAINYTEISPVSFWRRLWRQPLSPL